MGRNATFCREMFWGIAFRRAVFSLRNMTRNLAGVGVVVVLALSGCATTNDAQPEPQTPPLRIEDQSTDAPPPPPPSAAPTDAQAPSPSAAPSGPPSAPPGNVAAAPGSPPPPPSAPSDPSVTPAAPAQEAPPNAAQWAYEYPTGRWVYANGYGWMWVPTNADSVDSDGVPYTYLYTPTYGWTWYISPWGPGPYRYGLWVRHPWHPVGWHGAWVAHPRVVVRLGGPGRHYYGHRGRRW
jgi:hypothetical protein